MKLGDFLIFYAIFGEDKYAKWLSSTAVQLGTLAIEYMICVWIWTFWPTFTMAFLMMFTYFIYIVGCKLYKEVQFDKAEVIRKANALAEFERKWKEE